ncbi:MAG TPA: SPOR domain-containing protein [Gammaproteobacteria bacterium]|nr:SPOR domain-containing protein [Gammaproteobacteria bacterium]
MKERLIGACILVALAVIFIPMFFDEPAPAGMVTKNVELPAAVTGVSTYQMSLTRNTPPEPISPLVAAGKAPADKRSGKIDRTAAPATRTVDLAVNPEPATVKTKTVPVEVPPPQQQSTKVATAKPAASKADSAPADPAAQQPGWVVQAGSFANHDNAQRLTNRLKQKGFDAFILQAKSGGQTVYRVRVGPVDARRQAEKLAPAIAAASGGPTEVVSNP